MKHPFPEVLLLTLTAVFASGCPRSELGPLPGADDVDDFAPDAANGELVPGDDVLVEDRVGIGGDLGTGDEDGPKGETGASPDKVAPPPSDCCCPTAVIHCAEGDEVPPQTVLHLHGDESFAGNSTIQKWEWDVVQPSGSMSVFLPSADVANPTFEVNVAWKYTFYLTVYDQNNTPSCFPATYEVVVIPDEALHIELLWYTPDDPDQTDTGPEAGSDLDLHFVHPDAGGPDLDGDGKPDGWFDLPWDCFRFNPHPNWGDEEPAVDDDPGLDREDSDSAGPEILNLDEPEDIAYRVGVHYWCAHGYGWAYATARVYIYSQLVFEIQDVMMEQWDLWDVCTIDWPTAKTWPTLGGNGQYVITQYYVAPDFDPGPDC